jgi:hypothetical protein
MKRAGPNLVKSTSKTLRRDNSGLPKNARFEDVLEHIENEVKDREKSSKAKKTTADKAMLDSFYHFDLADTKLMLDNYLLTEEELKARFNFSSLNHHARTRGDTMTFGEAVAEVFDNNTLDKLMEWNVQHAKGKLPSILYGKNQGMSLQRNIRSIDSL